MDFFLIAQISDLVARITTTDAVVKRLDLNGGASAAIVIPNNKTWMFVISIVARNTLNPCGISSRPKCFCYSNLGLSVML